MKGLFDNYFVYQPMYEKYRLVMIIHNGLAHTLSINKMAEYNEDNFEQIDEELAQLIDEGSECKQLLLTKIEQSRAEIDKVSEDYQQQNDDEKTAQLSPQQLMSTITEEHVKPLLLELEAEIKEGLDSVISKLVAQKVNSQNQSEKLQTIAHAPPAIASKSKKVLAQLNKKDQNEEDISSNTDASNKVQISSKLNPKTKTKRSILVVEDNALYRDMLKNVLQKESFCVEEAEDGLHALEKIRKGNFDLIIMDLYMPKLDGLNTTKNMRKISGGKDVPVIALTGNKNKDIVKKWASYGLKGYILKPSTKEEILDTVGRVINPAVIEPAASEA